MARMRDLTAAITLLFAIQAASAIAGTPLGDLAESNDNLGGATATGDFNGDGCSDLAALAKHERYPGVSDRGIVHVVYGSGPLCVPRSSSGLPKLQIDGSTGLIPGGIGLPTSPTYTLGDDHSL